MEQEGVSQQKRDAERELEKMVTMVANEWAPDSRCEQLKTFILLTLDLYEKRLKLDKRTIFMAMEAKRNYSAMNYYQEMNFGYIAELEDLEKQKAGVYERLRKQEEDHEEQLKEIAEKQAVALQIRTEGIKGETAQWDLSLFVSCRCPYCNNSQDALTNWQEEKRYNEVQPCQSATFKEFEVECEKCGRHFEVKDAQY